MRYMTKQWFIGCQTGETKNPAEAPALAHAARERERLPEELDRTFYFHDGTVLAAESGENLTLDIKSAYSPHSRVVFRNALVKGGAPAPGDTWLYEELYRHKSGRGYEAHMLLSRGSELLETRIVCSDIQINTSCTSSI